MENELFEICCERDSEPHDQRWRLVKALNAGADVKATDKNGVTALHSSVRVAVSMVEVVQFALPSRAQVLFV
jgi:hypothetical protein